MTWLRRLARWLLRDEFRVIPEPLDASAWRVVADVLTTHRHQGFDRWVYVDGVSGPLMMAGRLESESPPSYSFDGKCLPVRSAASAASKLLNAQ